ncbi:MAG: hypothetical protein Q9207_007632 [Kuettlingeria erythrocarpa]
MDEEEAETEGTLDPVTNLWNCLRRGYPLMTIYNALNPLNPLQVDANRVAEKSIGKAATFKFLQACLTDLKIPANECFLITDLDGSDTTGFVKVTKVVNRVLDQLDERGLLLPSDPRYQDHSEGPGPGGKITHIQYVVREIVTSERTYVQHLEVLQQAKNQIEAGGNVPGDSIHDMFLNLNALLDFQRRFLIRIEQHNSLPESQQNWGRLFIQYKDSFRVYEPYIANQTRCNETVTREWDKIIATPHSQNLDDLFSSPAVFHAFCVKPFQRLSKYPLLLAQLGQKSELDDERKANLVEGEAAASSLMQRANEAVAKEQRIMAVADLQLRVEDWKGHNIKQFGELLLYGNFTVVKGEGPKAAEREVCVDFDTFSPTLQLHVRHAVGQWKPIATATAAPVPDDEAFGDKTQHKESTFAAPRKAHRGRWHKLLQRLYLCPIVIPTDTPAPSLAVVSRESSPESAGLSRSSSLRRPSSNPTLPYTPKKAEPPKLKTTSLPAHLSQLSFSSPVTAKLWQAYADEVKRSSPRTGSFNKPKSQKHEFHWPPMEQVCIGEKQLVNTYRGQYIIYLFERILLCCKEVNPNKQRTKMLRNDKTPVNLNGKIFWKGDPGVENFIIRFSNENEMNKWRDQVQKQKQSLGDSARGSGQTGTSETMFTSMKNLALLENPHLQSEDLEEDDDSSYYSTSTYTQSNHGQSNGILESSMSRNASSNSLRTMNTQVGGMTGRLPPSRLPNLDHVAAGQPPLSLNTNITPGSNTPGEFPGNSYFSPAADSPSSTRSSSQAAMYPFPRQGTPVDHWSHEDKKHKTAPAASRDGPVSINGYHMNGRTVMRPSLPAMPPSQAATAAQHLAMTQRMRSASTPNIHDPNAAPGNSSGGRRYANGQVQPTIDNVPVPPIPSHMAHMRIAPNRSQTSSPTNGGLASRVATQSPMLQRDRPGQHGDQSNYHPATHRQHPSQSDQRPPTSGGYPPANITVLRSPPMPMHTTSENEIPLPSQLKVKIWFQPSPSHVTIVVPIVIKHRSLIDRIDSKMVKISSASISKGTARLRYKDIDDDFVTITSDEDVQLAIEDWGQANEDDLRNGDVRDFELHWEEKGN